MIHPIEIELTKATGMKSPDRRDTATLSLFRTKLVQAVDKLADEDYDLLSSEAQEWINNAVDSLQGGKIPPDFNGEADEVEKQAVRPAKDSGPVRDTDKTKKLPTTPQNGPEMAKSGESKLSKKVKVRAKRGMTAGRRVKELMLEHGVNTDHMALVHMLRQENLRMAPSTLQSVVYEFKQSLALLVETGLLTSDQDKIKEALGNIKRD